jgi:hypothetical protein
MFKFQAEVEQCYIVQNNAEQLEEWAEPQPQSKQPPTTQLNQREQTPHTHFAERILLSRLDRILLSLTISVSFFVTTKITIWEFLVKFH